MSGSMSAVIVLAVIQVSWDVRLCSSVNVYPRFIGTALFGNTEDIDFIGTALRKPQMLQ
jgi:hypothetical protein